MKKIIITIPRNGNRWKFSFGETRGKTRACPGALYNEILKRLSRLELKEKTSISIKGYIGSEKETLNESLASTNKNYLIYTLTCFLEDYLGTSKLRAKEKRYSNSTAALPN